MINDFLSLLFSLSTFRKAYLCDRDVVVNFIRCSIKLLKPELAKYYDVDVSQ